MNLLTMVIPFIIIIAFIAIGSYFYKLGKKFFTIKITHWLLSFYLLLLIVATAIVPFMTESKAAMETVDQEDLDEDEVIDQLYNQLQKGEIDSIEDEFLISEQTFEYDQKDSLQINTASNDLGVSVFIEQKSENDGYIEASVFRPSMTINEMDFSEILKPYELEKDSDSLIIHAPVQDIHVSILGPSFPIRQLNQSSIISHYSSSRAEGIIYLRVPSDIKITSSDHVFLNYVEK